MNLIYVGVVISVGGNILISVALNIQKYSHNQNELAEVKKPYTRRPMWWLGLALVLIGEIGNFLGYAFAPASVVAPLGTTVLITNACIAWIVLKEKFRLQDFFGILLALGGAVVVVIFSASNKPPYLVSELLDALKETKFVVYLVITVVACIVLSLVSWRIKHRYLLIDMVILGIYGGYTVLSTKAISSFVTQNFAAMFTYWVFYVMILVLVGTGAMQIRYLQMSLETHDATEVVPIQYTLFTIFAVTASGMLYDDFTDMPPMNIGLFVLGILLIFSGVFLITKGRIKPKMTPKDVEANLVEAHSTSDTESPDNINNSDKTAAVANTDAQDDERDGYGAIDTNPETKLIGH